MRLCEHTWEKQAENGSRNSSRLKRWRKWWSRCTRSDEVSRESSRHAPRAAAEADGTRSVPATLLEVPVNDVLTIILAGGKGTRLEPLTRDRAKPAVPFGGLYRIIDFTLSNCLNSGLRNMLVLTQYKARSLDRHIATGWSFLSRELNEYIDVLPPQQRIDEHWYKGTADAIYQNIYSIEKADPRHVLILAGDHIYKLDYGDMIRQPFDR